MSRVASAARFAEYGRRIASRYDEWYEKSLDTEGAVQFLHSLANGGAVLELGIGTGRLAVPLAAGGLRVTGIDCSSDMLDVCRSKVQCSKLDLVACTGDMSNAASYEAVVERGPYAVAFCVFNTFLALTDFAEKQACLLAITSLLHPGGKLVLEFQIPDSQVLGEGTSMDMVNFDASAVTLECRDHDANEQTVRLLKIVLGADGIDTVPAWLHYLTLNQLEDLAQAVGLALDAGWSDWRGTEWIGPPSNLVSVWSMRST